MKKLKTLTPFGLELVTVVDDMVGNRCISWVDDGKHEDYIYFMVHQPDIDLPKAHQTALNDFLRLAKEKDLREPIN